MKKANEESFRESDILTKKQNTIGIYSVIFIIMVSVGRIQEVIPGLIHLYLGKVTFGLAILLLILNPSPPKISLKVIPQMRYLIYIYILGLISTPFSAWPTKSANFMVFEFPNLVIMLVLIIKMVGTGATDEIKKIVCWTIGSICLLGCAAIVLNKGGRAASSFTYDPNDVAFIMVIFFPIIYFLIRVVGKLGKLFLAGSLVVAFITIIITQSRGGFLGFLLVVLVIVFQDRSNIGKVLLGSLLFGVIFLASLPSGYLERMSTITDPQVDYNVTHSEGRIEIWKRGLTMVANHPFLGVGPAAFDAAELSEGGRYRPTHNLFIQIAAEFGIPGFILFMMIIITSIRSLRRIKADAHQNFDVKMMASGLEIAFYGYMSAGFFLSQAYAPVLFFLVGISIALSLSKQITVDGRGEDFSA